MANNFTWWIYKFIHKIPKYFIQKPDYFCLPAITSACIFKDTLRNQTQVFFKVRNTILRFVYNSFNFNCTLDFLPSTDAEQRCGNIKRNPASGKCTRITRDTDHSSIFTFRYQLPASSIHNLDQ